MRSKLSVLLMAALLLGAALWLRVSGPVPSVASSPPQNPRPGSVQFTDPNRVAVIPFRLVDNHLFVRGRIGDSDSLWFIVDTGAASHCISLTTAARLGLPVHGHIHAMGANGTEEGGRVAHPDIELPGLSMHPDSIDAIPLQRIGVQSGLGCDGVIGYALFRDSAVEIDYDGGLLTIRDGRTFEYHGSGAAIPFRLTNNHPYISARVTLPGRKPAEGRFVIDTGSAMALLMSPTFVKDQRPIETLSRTIQARVGGVGGSSMSPMGRIDRLEIGPYSLKNPIAAFRQPGAGQISASGTAGNIGGDILRRFRVIFDYPRQRMILEPGLAFDEAFEADMSGLVVRARDDSSRALEIVAVQTNSPASEQEVAEGDILESLDGQPVSWLDLPRLRQAFRRENQTYRLELRHGRDRKVVVLTTRRLI